MTGSEPSGWEIVSRLLVAATAELSWASVTGSPPNPTGVAQIVFDEVIERRRSKAHQFANALSDGLERDVLLAALATDDDERDAVLASALQAAVSSGSGAKRSLLAKVARSALTSSEPVDEEQLVVAALMELEAPHIRALTRIANAEDNMIQVSNDWQEALQPVLLKEPAPVLAALTRTGVVLQGSVEDATHEGMFLIPEPETYSIIGVSDFGRRLLRDLRESEVE